MSPRSDRLASIGDPPRRLSLRDAWALRRHRIAAIGGGVDAPPAPRYKNVFPELGAVFVHIPKTAGTSVHHLLSSVTPDRAGALSGNAAALARVRRDGLTKHSKAREYVARLGEALWASTFTFSFVRNPFDLMVSSYVWWLQRAPVHPHLRHLAAEVARMPDFDAFLRSRFGCSCINEFVGEPHDWFLAGDRELVDFVGRVEDLERDMERVLDRLGVERARRPALSRLNRTRRQPHRDYYTDATRALVETRFRYEIERFDYTF